MNGYVLLGILLSLITGCSVSFTSKPSALYHLECRDNGYKIYSGYVDSWETYNSIMSRFTVKEKTYRISGAACLLTITPFGEGPKK